MTLRICFTVLLFVAFLIPMHLIPLAEACCCAPPSGKPVVNADQTVIILWDAATKTQHFIRQANFKSAADDFGFLVPSPAQPELNESGNAAFPYLRKLTEPELRKVPRPSGINCGCSRSAVYPQAAAVRDEPAVRVLEEKLVAGFKATVLETNSVDALVNWLRDNGYAYSPEVEAWAKPYVEARWKFTALKVAKGKADKDSKTVAASALRMTFKTDRPLFPYREPDTRSAADALQAKDRLLRIYFLADARYQGALTKETAWTGKAAWANKLSSEDRKKTLELLNLPETSGPAEWWLTEFEDNWPYKLAPADVYFSADTNQDTLKRPPIVEYVSTGWPSDLTCYAIAVVLIVPLVLRRVRSRRQI